jgi:signal transduction histidine kinase
MGTDLVKFVSAGYASGWIPKDGVRLPHPNSGLLRDMEGEERSEFEKVQEELVSNVLRHSGASLVRLRLSAGAKGLRLRFSDDGVGFDPAAFPSSSFGIENIRFRVRRLGGSVSIRTSPGQGVDYSVLIPFRKANHEK